MTAFAPRSISLRLYPHDLAPGAALDEMCAQAALAIRSGFDGVMVSERHGGIVGNVPNPVQVAAWLAAAMPGGWVAPCPVLSLLRPPPLIVEEIAWLAARYPDRVGAGLGAGGNRLDFDLYGVADSDLADRFGTVLTYVAEHLTGRADDPLCADPAVARCATHPIPVVSAVMSRTAARRAAACGVGIIGSSLLDPQRERELGFAYRRAGGAGPEVLIRFVWLGDPPAEAIATKYGDYRRSAAAAGRRIAGASEILTAYEPAELAQRLVQLLSETGRTALHLRVHVPGVPPADIRNQIIQLGRHVLPIVREAWPQREEVT